VKNNVNKKNRLGLFYQSGGVFDFELCSHSLVKKRSGTYRLLLAQAIVFYCLLRAYKLSLSSFLEGSEMQPIVASVLCLLTNG